MPSIVPFRFSRTARAVGLALAVSGAASSALAADEGSALENMLVRDSNVELQLRTYFFDKLNPAPKNNNALKNACVAKWKIAAEYAPTPKAINI